MQNSQSKSVKVAAAAGTNSQEYIYNDLGEVARTEAFVIVPNVAITANDTDYITLTIKKGSTTLATQNTKITGGAAMVAGTPITMTLGANGVGANLELASAGVFDVAVASSGAGKAYDFKVQCVLRGIRQ